jgi:hypothetical protein
MVRSFVKTNVGFFQRLMETMYNDRTKYKKLMLQASQEYENTKDPKTVERTYPSTTTFRWLKKISLNSAYGAIGNNYFPIL